MVIISITNDTHGLVWIIYIDKTLSLHRLLPSQLLQCQLPVASVMPLKYKKMQRAPKVKNNPPNFIYLT